MRWIDWKSRLDEIETYRERRLYLVEKNNFKGSNCLNLFSVIVLWNKNLTSLSITLYIND